MKTNHLVASMLFVTILFPGCKKINDKVKQCDNFQKEINPKDFVNGVDNKYFPLVPGDTLVYRNTIIEKDTSIEDDYVAVTHKIKVIQGVNCTVIHDFVKDPTTAKLLEDTYDYYAQDDCGNVWYFGEDTKSYNPDGTFSTEGTFTAGVDGAKAGVIMPGNPYYSKVYYQEYYSGHAED